MAETGASSPVYDVVVVGAGVVGSTAAYYAACVPGTRVLLLEQFSFLHSLGSSHGESRITRLTYPDEDHTRMMAESFRLWDEAAEAAGTQLMERTGGLDYGHPEGELGAVIKSCQRNKVPFTKLTPEQVQSRFGIHIPSTYVGVYQSHSGVLNPVKTLAVFQHLARSQGAELRDRECLVAVDRGAPGSDGLIEIRTTKGVYRSRKVIISPGAWLSKAALLVGLSINVCVKKACVNYFRTRDPKDSKLYDAAGGMPVFIDYLAKIPSANPTHVYGIPALEFPGLIKVCSHNGTETTIESRTFTPPDSTALSSYVREYLPKLDPKPVLQQTCLYTVTPDELFIVDKHPEDPRIVIGGGCSGHGFKFGPLLGKALAELAIHGTSDLQLHAWKIDRPGILLKREARL